MSNTPHYEDSVENSFCVKISRWAKEVGVDVVTLKLNLKGRRGFPDRLILWAGGNLRFIEFKRRGEAPRKLQVFVHKLLLKMGFIVEVYDDGEHALREIQAQIRATTPTNEGYVARGKEWWVPPVSEAGAGEDSSSPESIRRTEEEGPSGRPAGDSPLTSDNN